MFLSIAHTGGLPRLAICALFAIIMALTTSHGVTWASPAAPEEISERPVKNVRPVVNINTATEEELTFLPGIGVERAERIVAYRQKRRFKKISELARVSGIGLKTVRTLRPWLTLEGKTTAVEPLKSRR